MSKESAYAAFDEGGKDEIVLTFFYKGEFLTVVTDKNPKGAPLVAPSVDEELARATHASKLAQVKAGKLGEFDTNEDDMA